VVIDQEELIGWLPKDALVCAIEKVIESEDEGRQERRVGEIPGLIPLEQKQELVAKSLKLISFLYNHDKELSVAIKRWTMD